VNIPKFESNKKYSYRDYLTWNDNEQWELIEGIPYLMTPAPSEKHQRISRELLVEFALYLRGKKCEVYDAPFDVRLIMNEKDTEIFNVVQPDISVICDPGKIDDKGCLGSPDLIIEIISPSTGKHDRWVKYKLYEQAGVREYWIVEPSNDTVEVFKLNTHGKYELTGVFGKGDCIIVGIFEDLSVDLNLIF
jgi:Uma2 family endonuclease